MTSNILSTGFILTIALIIGIPILICAFMDISKSNEEESTFTKLIDWIFNIIEKILKIIKT